VRNAKDVAPLAGADEKLAPLFKSLATAKVDAVKNIFKPLEYAAFHRRALKRPLSDIGLDGRIAEGALNMAAGLSLDKALPRSFAAYKGALQVFVERVGRKPLSAKHQAELGDDYNRAVSKCVTAEGKVRESEGALVECGFGPPCDATMLTELGGDLTNARIDSTVAQLKVVLTAESLDGAPPAPDKAARCVEPWW
jgi:hypothetical protein